MKPLLWLVIFTLLILPSIGQETESRTRRRNPYLELNSYFEFKKTGDPLQDWNSARTWQSSDGRTIEAKILSADSEYGHFLLSSANHVKIPLNRFSQADQRFVAEWLQISRYFNLGYQKSRNVTNTIQAGIGDGAFAKEGKIHETRNFRFESDQPLNATTVKDFSRMFEATFTTMRELPLGLEVEKPKNGKFLVRLFADKADYHRAGGPQKSAGVYVLKSREILVPFESLGLKRSGKSYRKATASDPSTLVHEIAHAVMHQWLNYMPMWVAEGLADYVAAIPYKNGSFFLNQHEEGIYKMVATNFGGDALRFPILNPETFVFLDSDSYMLRPSEKESSINLTAVIPYQIRLQGQPEPSAPSPTNPPIVADPREIMPDSLPGVMLPVPVNQNPSSLVVQRYSSSMLLLHELISGGQVESLRKYLFAHLHFNWDCEKYVADYNDNLEDYQAKVKKQIAEFDLELKKFNAKIHAYNDVVALRNNGSDVALPTIPKDPIPPVAIPVPEILAVPRVSETFSAELFRHESVVQYLTLPPRLSL